MCSEIDKPDPPGPAAKKAFYRRLVNLTDDARRRFKERLLDLKQGDVLSVGQKYFFPGNDEQGVAVISNEDQLKKANGNIAGPPLEINRI